MLTPESAGINAAMICPANLVFGFSATISSMIPRTTRIRAPMRMERNSVPNGTKNSTLTKKPAKIARPPILGIGTLCIRRLSFGTSTALILMASILTAGVQAKEIANAKIKANRLVSVRLLSIICYLRFQQVYSLGTKPTFFCTLLNVRAARRAAFSAPSRATWSR